MSMLKKASPSVPSLTKKSPPRRGSTDSSPYKIGTVSRTLTSRPSEWSSTISLEWASLGVDKTLKTQLSDEISYSDPVGEDLAKQSCREHSRRLSNGWEFASPSLATPRARSSRFSVSEVEEEEQEIIMLKSRRVTWETPWTEDIRNIIEEFESTEASYLQKLGYLAKDFYRGLRAYIEVAGEEPLAAPLEIGQMFGNINAVLCLSEYFHGRFLKFLGHPSFDSAKFCEIFDLKKADLLKVYSEYALRVEYGMRLRKYIEKANSKLASFVKRTEFTVECSLNSLQLEPVQRIMRYGLLLRDLVKKCTDETQRTEISNLCDSMERIVQAIDRRLALDNSKRMVYILQESLFRGKVSFVTDSRLCIRCSYLNKISPSQRTMRQFFILFSDFLTYSAMSRDKETGTMRHCIPLVAIAVEDLEDSGTLVNAFRVRSTLKTLLLIADSPEQKRAWVEDIRAASLAIISNAAPEHTLMGDEIEARVTEGAETRTKLPEVIVFSDECPWLFEPKS